MNGMNKFLTDTIKNSATCFSLNVFHATFAKLLAMLIADTVIHQITCYADC